jgi:hypothetical protein
MPRRFDERPARCHDRPTGRRPRPLVRAGDDLAAVASWLATAARPRAGARPALDPEPPGAAATAGQTAGSAEDAPETDSSGAPIR